MYNPQTKSKPYIALIFYIVMFITYWIAGVFYNNPNHPLHSLIYYLNFLLMAGATAIVFLNDRKWSNLGFSRKYLTRNFLISCAIILLAIVSGLLISKYPTYKVMKAIFYFLLNIAFAEELLFRGFIQSYLFGLKTNKWVIYLLGALIFSLIHLPFQMYAHQNVGLSYIIEAMPQLIVTFLFHLCFTWLTKKTGDITLPTAIHFVLDFLQNI